MKILFFASYPKLAIGYARIGNILSNHLAEQGHDIYYFGISNFNENMHVPRYIHPNIKIIDALAEEKKNGSNELYGVHVICDVLNEIKPDILFLYNDLIVISRIFNNFIDRKIERNFKTYVYLDLVYEYEKVGLIQHINSFSDKIIVFSECWKKNLISMKVNEDKISILPHGFDVDKFYQNNTIESRKHFGFKEDDFIILNTNRNNYRKCIDKTIDAFIKFLKIKESDSRIKLYLNMNCDSKSMVSGYDIMNQIKISCIVNDIDYSYVITNHIFISNNITSTSITDELLNHLYNSCDVGINTCVGEGFGLCNLEHGGLGKAQIISGVGALNDIFNNDYSTVIKPVTEVYVSDHIDYHGGYLKICSTDDFVDAMIKYFDNRELCKTHGEKARTWILNNYNWVNILEKLDNIISN